MTTFNKLAARKELGAILHRLDEPNLHTNILRRIVRRHIENLNETLPVEEFGATLIILRDALTLERWGEIRTTAELLRELIPTTYGMLPSGTVFKHLGALATKRKEGLDIQGYPAFALHLAADRVVEVVNV